MHIYVLKYIIHSKIVKSVCEEKMLMMTTIDDGVCWFS